MISNSMSKKLLLLLGCFASSVLMASENSRPMSKEKYSISILGEHVELDRTIYPIFVFEKNKRGAVAWDHFDRPVKSYKWDETQEDVLHVKLVDGKEHSLKIK